jgi:hypothetical protein
MKKAINPEGVNHFEEIPNIGEAMAEDFRLLGISHPSDLKKQNPYELYLKLCRKTKKYQDPCVLDVFLSAVYFMKGKGTKMWWEFTDERKKNFHIVAEEIERLKLKG